MHLQVRLQCCLCHETPSAFIAQERLFTVRKLVCLQQMFCFVGSFADVTGVFASVRFLRGGFGRFGFLRGSMVLLNVGIMSSESLETLAANGTREFRVLGVLTGGVRAQVDMERSRLDEACAVQMR